MTNFAAAASTPGNAVLPVDYSRLRIGIDAPGRVPQKAYVLEAFGKAQFPLIDAALDKAVSAVETWITGGIERAMNKFNGAAGEG